MPRYVVFDDNGIVHESDDAEAAMDEFDSTEDFDGDLILAQIIARRR